MIILVKKNNLILIALIFLLSIAIYNLNVGNHDDALVSGPQNLERVVLVDPGHGGEDPGVVGYNTSIKEKDLNLAVATKLKELLEADGYRVIMSRSEDKLVYTEGITSETEMRRQDLTRRKKMMDESGASIVVSIHMNAIPQTQYYGAQTFYPPESPESQKLAIAIQKSMKEIADPTNKREALVKKPNKPGEKNIMILRDLKTTTAIVECGFLSHLEEEKKLGTKEYQDTVALAIKEGIKKYFEAK